MKITKEKDYYPLYITQCRKIGTINSLPDRQIKAFARSYIKDNGLHSFKYWIK